MDFNFQTQTFTTDFIDNATPGEEILIRDLVLPTTGGTPDILDFYETYITSSNTWTGPYASPIAGNITLVRLGKMVIARFPQISGTSTTAASITSTEAIPSRFITTDSGFFECNMRIISNSVVQVTPGMLHARTDGLFQIFLNCAAASFANVGTAQFYPFTAKWLVT